MTAPLTDANQQLKFRKSMGSSIGVVFSAVILRGISRRSAISTSSNHGVRRVSSTSTTKILSAGDAASLADQVRVHSISPSRLVDPSPDLFSLSSQTQTAFKGGAVTAAMQNFGMQGIATLIGSIRVYRCGFELNCDGSTPAPPLPPANATVVEVAESKPFPIEEVAKVGGIIIGVPIACGVVALIAGFFLKLKFLRRKKIARAEAIAEYKEWVVEKMEELEAMDEDDRYAICITPACFLVQVLVCCIFLLFCSVIFLSFPRNVQGL